ncbi:MAG: hypothetical protein KBS75_08470 [Bacteroidales bacterium]|nr:hypothetical protein [Candidatus Equimonas faecalis]
MYSPQSTQEERLQMIEQRKKELDRQIRIKERRMRSIYDALTAPSTRPSGLVSKAISNVSTMAAIADGLLIGYRVLRKFRRII